MKMVITMPSSRIEYSKRSSGGPPSKRNRPARVPKLNLGDVRVLDLVLVEEQLLMHRAVRGDPSRPQRQWE